MNGVVVLDKPAGLSSAQALAPLKSTVGRRVKVGHAGTLDPFATGVLLALVGDATRLSNLAMALPKTYFATVRFGRQTDTLDPMGTVVAETDPGSAAPAGLADALRAFHGTIEQVPPAYSALKVDGRRAYKLARAGAAPALAARAVTVHATAVVDVRWPCVDVEIRSGAGFYVRSFARDWGALLDLPASLDALRRTAIGPFTDGVAPADADPARALPAAMIVRAADVPQVTVSRADALRFAVGRDLDAPAGATGSVALFAGPMLVGLGEVEGTRLRPRSVFSVARRDLEAG